MNFGFCFRVNDSIEEWVASFEPMTTHRDLTGKQTVVSDGENQAVLIDIVNLMESPESIIPAFVRSWIDSATASGRLLPSTFLPFLLSYSSMLGQSEIATVRLGCATGEPTETSCQAK